MVLWEVCGGLWWFVVVCGNSMYPSFWYRDNEASMSPFCLFNFLLNVNGKQLR